MWAMLLEWNSEIHIIFRGHIQVGANQPGVLTLNQYSANGAPTLLELNAFESVFPLCIHTLARQVLDVMKKQQMLFI